MLKEADILEVNKAKLISKMEKLELDLYSLATIHKKLIGTDGLKNEYYFLNGLPNKVLIKKFMGFKEDMMSKQFEWGEINNEEELKALLACLSDKGIRESNLIHKIKKLLKKKLKFNACTQIEAKTEEEILNQLLACSNCKMDLENNNNGESVEGEDKERKFFQEIFEKLEFDIAEYLKQDKKEWESFQVRQDISAFINASDSIIELGKCLVLLNERFKNPYKQHEFKSKIISDEEEYSIGTIISFERKINLDYIDSRRIMAPKSKLFYEQSPDFFFIQ